MSEMIIKPNLFIPGAGKSGTSSLHEYLNQHPHIFMSSVKEPHFFSNDRFYYSEEERNKYFNLFSSAKDYQYRGESSTGYMVFPNTIERIKKEIEDPKFIFVLRNPIDRAFSHYNWVRSFLAEDQPFKEAILSDMNLEPDPNNTFGRGYKYYFQFGLYYKWLKGFYGNFDAENIFIMATEKLKEETINALNQCFHALNLKPVGSIDTMRFNETINYKNIKFLSSANSFLGLKKIPAKYKRKFPIALRVIYRRIFFSMINYLKNILITKDRPQISSIDRKWLRDCYIEDVIQLRELCGYDFVEWSDFN